MENLTTEEMGLLAILRVNKKTPIIEIKKEFDVFGWHINFEWRSSKNIWGRFGGGWNWKIGLQWSHTDYILSLLICTIRINRRKLTPNKR